MERAVVPMQCAEDRVALAVSLVGQCADQTSPADLSARVLVWTVARAMVWRAVHVTVAMARRGAMVRAAMALVQMVGCQTS